MPLTKNEISDAYMARISNHIHAREDISQARYYSPDDALMVDIDSFREILNICKQALDELGAEEE